MGKRIGYIVIPLHPWPGIFFTPTSRWLDTYRDRLVTSKQRRLVLGTTRKRRFFFRWMFCSRIGFQLLVKLLFVGVMVLEYENAWPGLENNEEDGGMQGQGRANKSKIYKIPPSSSQLRVYFCHLKSVI